ncbi:hypothetical protein [Silvanigrella aquatica]|uniref:Outer membrane protein beta-barrel domain-containing protein n=1 Tax=Silvanigrella aquatica TaxID=1915309 RepID=A0A1L4CYC0_9BACT|nr:hypothetical protein [Silvanigrella aquatica]APJ02949.1 hypothetical protein AXG55_03075 [Silvanigrella aquatica]
MRGSLKILIFIFFISYFSNNYAQVDPTIPIPQRNLQNTLINPIINSNPFIGETPVQAPPPKTPQKVTPNSQKQDKAKEQNQILKKEEVKEKPKEEVKEKPKEEVKEQAKEQAKEKTPEKEEPKGDAEDGLFGSFRIGPMVGFGVTMGPNISIESKLFHYLGFSISYGAYNNLNLFNIPNLQSMINGQSTDFQLNSLLMNYSQLEGKISIFPFGGSFFIGAAYGQRKIEINSVGTINLTITGIPTRLSTNFDEIVQINSTYWTPQMGWLATWGGKFGWFAVGSEFGVQLTLQSSVTTSTTFLDPTVQQYVPLALQSPEYTSFNNQISSTLTNTLKNTPLPYWNILKIGWMF